MGIPHQQPIFHEPIEQDDPKTFNWALAGIVSGTVQGTAEQRSIYIPSLPWEATKKDIIKFLHGTGPIESVEIKARNKGSRRYAIVEFAEKNDKDTALKLDGERMGRRRVRVLSMKPGFKYTEPVGFHKHDVQRVKYTGSIEVQKHGLRFSNNKENLIQGATKRQFVPASRSTVFGDKSINDTNKTKHPEINMENDYLDAMDWCL